MGWDVGWDGMRTILPACIRGSGMGWDENGWDENSSQPALESTREMAVTGSNLKEAVAG